MAGPDLKDAFSLDDSHFQSLKLFCVCNFRWKRKCCWHVMICSSSRTTHRRWQPWILWFQ